MGFSLFLITGGIVFGTLVNFYRRIVLLNKFFIFILISFFFFFIAAFTVRSLFYFIRFRTFLVIIVRSSFDFLYSFFGFLLRRLLNTLTFIIGLFSTIIIIFLFIFRIVTPSSFAKVLNLRISTRELSIYSKFIL